MNVSYLIFVLVFPNGTGYDLSSVATQYADNYLEAITKQNLTFFFHPCGDVKSLPSIDLKVNECKDGYSVCLFNTSTTVEGNVTVTTTNATVLGKMEDLSFVNHELKFAKSLIQLQCTPDAEDSVLYAPLENNAQTVSESHEVLVEINYFSRQQFLVLYTKAACLKTIIEPRGFFYTMFLVALTLLFAYLFIGMLVNYFLIGARGYELIPNYDFWCKVWRSLKLFYIYVKNGCRITPAEDSYDAI